MIKGLPKRIRKRAYKSYILKEYVNRLEQRAKEKKDVYDPEIAGRWQRVARRATRKHRKELAKRKAQIETYSSGPRFDRAYFLAKEHSDKFSKFEINVHDYTVRVHSSVNQDYMKNTFNTSWDEFWKANYNRLKKMVRKNENSNGLERAQAEIFNHLQTLMHVTGLITPAEFDKHRISYYDLDYKYPKMRATNPEKAYFITPEVKDRSLAAYERFQQNNSFAWFKRIMN
jgi:hypothetical protein